MKSEIRCLYCMEKAVVWDADFSYEDYGMEGEGVITEWHCANCKARMLCFISLESEEENEKEV